MTVQISPHKISRIFRYYFKGVTQLITARKVGVNQSTVSLYVSAFKEMAEDIGLTAAGEEFEVFIEVDGLRSLAVELYKAKLTTEDAKQGLDIINKFIKLGINPEKHSAIISVCKEVDDPRFIHCAIRFMEIEYGSNLSYEETIQRFEDAAQRLAPAENKLREKQEKIKSINLLISQKQQVLTDLEFQLEQFRDEVNAKKAQLRREREDEMRLFQITHEEINETRNLKSLLRNQSLDISTLIQLAKEFQQ